MVKMCLPLSMDEPGERSAPRRTLELRTQEQLRAVSNLTRHRVIDRLRDGEASMSGLASELGIKKGSASYHLRVLERAGIVRVDRIHKIRGVYERFYVLTADRFVWPDPLPGAATGVLRSLIADIERVPASADQLVGRRRSRVSAARYDEFSARLHGLIEDFGSDDTSDAETAQLAVVLFRDGIAVAGETATEDE